MYQPIQGGGFAPVYVRKSSSPTFKRIIAEVLASGRIFPSSELDELAPGMVGTDAKDGPCSFDPPTCLTCLGRGDWIARFHWFGPGRHQAVTCPDCLGSGVLPARARCTDGKSHRYVDEPTSGVARSGLRGMVCSGCGQKLRVDTTG